LKIKCPNCDSDIEIIINENGELEIIHNDIEISSIKNLQNELSKRGIEFG
jgi:hypothetical protein